MRSRLCRWLEIHALLWLACLTQQTAALRSVSPSVAELQERSSPKVDTAAPASPVPAPASPVPAPASPVPAPASPVPAVRLQPALGHASPLPADLRNRTPRTVASRVMHLELTRPLVRSNISNASGESGRAHVAEKMKKQRGFALPGPENAQTMILLLLALGILLFAIGCFSCTLFRRRGNLRARSSGDESERFIGHRPAGREPPPVRDTIVPSATGSVRISQGSRRPERLKNPRSGPDRPSIAEEKAEETKPQVVLCPLLVIPDSTRLDCLIERTLCRTKQDLSFVVRGISGTELFQVRVAENGAKAMIHLETLGGREQLAAVATEELWKGAQRYPALEIFHQGGTPYGSLQKIGLEYVVQDHSSVLFRFSGNYAQHQYEVKNLRDQTVASVNWISDTTYKVVVHSQNDAGLMILGALAIDKCEIQRDAAAA